MTSLQYITDNTGRKISVVLPIEQYEKLMEELEGLDDIRLYDEAKQEKEESIPFDEYLEQRNKRRHG